MQFLYETVKEILDAGRVGVPVFVRCIAHVAPMSEHIGDVPGRIMTMACSWLQASPLKVYARIDDNLRQITATIKFADGQTALVSVNAVPTPTARVDLTVLGNKGAVYHDSESLPPGFDMSAEPLPVPEWLLDALERSIRVGKPAIIQEVTEFE